MSLTKTNKAMTLKEITDLLEVRHDKAMKKVEIMAQDSEFGAMSKIDIVYNDRGQKIETLKLDKRQSIAVASRLNTSLLMRIIDRWQELEQPTQMRLPQTMSEALQLAADQAKQLEDQAPKVEVYNSLADRKSDVNTTKLAKQLGMRSAQSLNKILRAKGVKMMMHDLPKAGYVDWFNVVAVVNNDHESSQCLITPLGQIEITKLINKETLQ